MKRILSIIVTIVLLGSLSCTSIVFASEDSVDNTISFEIPIYSSEAEAAEAIQKSVSLINVYGTLSRRSPTSQHVTIRLSVQSPNYLTNAIRFQSLSLESTSYLPHTVYGSISAPAGGYRTYNYTASTIGYVDVGVISVPTSVTKARITAKNFDIYVLKKGAWISGAGFGPTVSIH